MIDQPDAVAELIGDFTGRRPVTPAASSGLS
jgi:hypothetical protein